MQMLIILVILIKRILIMSSMKKENSGIKSEDFAGGITSINGRSLVVMSSGMITRVVAFIAE